ncbi:MAG: hypothetical protein Q4D02_01940 [Clostridia bacterium]|nr:hypothetical protein [Clostridia bacterium]
MGYIDILKTSVKEICDKYNIPTTIKEVSDVKESIKTDRRV